MKRGLLVLAGAGIFWLLVFGLAKFPPTENELLLRYAGWSKFAAVSLPVSFAAELPYPITTATLSLITPNIPVSLFWFRAINLFFGLVLLLLIYKLFPKAGFVLTTVTCLGVVAGVMFDLPETITTGLVVTMVLVWLQMVEGPHKYIWLGFMGLWVSQTSWHGWLWLVVFTLGIIGRTQKKVWVVAGAIFLLIFGWHNNLANTAARIDPDVGSRVDQRVRYETKLNNYREPVPLFIKRLVYNKAYFSVRELAINLIQKLRIENWSFPGQQDATVARSLWGSKGLMWINFWYWPLLIFGITKWRDMGLRIQFAVGTLGVWGLTGSTMGFFIAVLLVVSWLVSRQKPIFQKLVTVLVVITAIPNFYHFLNQEEIWRDNRPRVHLAMARMAQRRGNTRVSTILGRPFLYFGWINQIPPEEFWQGVEAGMKIRGVKFDHFEKPTESGIYVGLPGEFLGSRGKDNKNEFSQEELPENWQLIETVNIRDTVSFGNGDNIWAVKVGQ